jgi:AraC-like DNA-binding protein
LNTDNRRPLEVLWEHRLDGARRELLAPEENTTVKSVADKYGFQLARFPAQYRRRFGQLPSMTLRLGRLGHKL